MQIILELQKAIYKKLSDINGSLINKVNGIHHHICQNTVFPYVMISENNLKEISNFVETVFEIQVKIRVFDKKENNSTILSIADDIVNMLRDVSDFVINGFNLVDSHFLSLNNLLADDEKIWKCELCFNFIVRKE